MNRLANGYSARHKTETKRRHPMLEQRGHRHPAGLYLIDVIPR